MTYKLRKKKPAEVFPRLLQIQHIRQGTVRFLIHLDILMHLIPKVQPCAWPFGMGVHTCRVRQGWEFQRRNRQPAGRSFTIMQFELCCAPGSQKIEKIWVEYLSYYESWYESYAYGRCHILSCYVVLWCDFARQVWKRWADQSWAVIPIL